MVIVKNSLGFSIPWGTGFVLGDSRCAFPKTTWAVVSGFSLEGRGLVMLMYVGCHETAEMGIMLNNGIQNNGMLDATKQLEYSGP